MDTANLGLKPQVLIAAVTCSGGDLKKTFTAEDLLIKAWEKNKSAWGLRGYEDFHPDPEKIYKELNRRGKNDLVGMGFVEQVSPMVFRLTPAGLAEASTLDPDNMKIKERASRELQEEIKVILSHPVFRAWLDDPTSPRSFHKAGSFWGIAPGTPPKMARKRVSSIDETLEASERFLTMRGVEMVSDQRGQNLFDRQDIQRCTEFQCAMKERFAKELRRMGAIEGTESLQKSSKKGDIVVSGQSSQLATSDGS